MKEVLSSVPFVAPCSGQAQTKSSLCSQGHERGDWYGNSDRIRDLTSADEQVAREHAVS